MRNEPEPEPSPSEEADAEDRLFRLDLPVVGSHPRLGGLDWPYTIHDLMPPHVERRYGY
jgi:hypothetical protein